MTRSDVAAEPLLALGAEQQRLQPHPTRELALGTLSVTRALPVKGKRLVGPWCFLDRFGPLTFTDGRPMDVAPHPHMGLQTVTWLLEGEVLHDDSLGHEARLAPGGVNVMTSGHAIAHAEQTPADHTGRLDGVQLWTALPEQARHAAPSFQHLPAVPSIEHRGGLLRVFSGALAGMRSPAQHVGDLVGADLQVHSGETLNIPLEPGFEHAVLTLRGDCTIEGQLLDARLLYDLGAHRSEVAFSSRGGARILLVGGPPFGERILMWWNFVARTPEEIREAREDWEQGRRFGAVTAYAGPRLAAPELVRLARPNPIS